MANSGSEVGNGYVLIKPKLDDGAISSLEAQGNKGGGKFGGAFSVAAGNLIAGAVQKIGSAVADTFVQAFNNYANFEQLSGGVEKIFDQANTDQIFKDAQNAYKDLNMSANQYLESINQVGAAFAQTMGDQKGYDTARLGMKAISDYASGTGRNLDELNEKYALITRSTSSYQSIADQFSGILPATSEDFLKQAQAAGFLSGEYTKLTDVPVAEYQEAVSKMLEKGVADMGLAGNTLAESTGTISGSLAMLKASWDNFLTGLLDPNADIGMLGERLLESLGAVIQNIIPVVMTLATNVVMNLPNAIINALTAIPGMLAPVITSIFGEQVGGQINDALGGAFSDLATTVQTYWAALADTFMAVWEAIQPVIMLIGDLIATVMPIIMDAISIVVDFMVNNVLPLIQEIAATVQPVIEEIAASIQEHLPEIQSVIETVMGVIKGVIDTVWPYVKDIVIGAVNAISSIIKTVWPIISQIISVAMNVIQTVIKTAWPVIKGIIETVMGAIRGIMEHVWPVISGIVQTAAGAITGAINGIRTVVNVVRNIFDSIKRAIEDPIGTARRFIEDAINTIRNLFNFNIEWPHIPLPHFRIWGSPNPLDWLEGDTPGFAIDWYAKGGFVDGATLIGAGEAGPEMILPRQGALMNDFADRIAQRIGGGVDIHDCTFNVRSESDIRRVAEELNTLINRQQAGAFA